MSPVEAALVWAQELGFSGDRLPTGERFKGFHCPLSNATGLYVNGERAWDPVEGESDEDSGYDLPPLVRTFARHFDAGFYPEYDKDAQVEGGQVGCPRPPEFSEFLEDFGLYERSAV